MKVQLAVGTGKNRGEENLEYWLVPTHTAYTVSVLLKRWSLSLWLNLTDTTVVELF